MSVGSSWDRLMSRPGIRRARGALALLDDAGKKVMEPLARALTHPAIIATVVLLVSLGTLVRVATHHKAPLAAAPQVFGVRGEDTQSGGRVLPSVAALKQRYQSDILITSSNPLSDAQIQRARTVAGNGPSLLIATGQVTIGNKGTTRAIGIDPGTFRGFTPKQTAESTPLWQYIQLGDVAVAHTLARAQDIRLPSAVIVRNGSKNELLEVAAYATTGLPGVGLIVNKEKSRLLGLKEHSGLIISVRGVDPSVATTLVRQALPTMNVLPVHIALSKDGRLQWVPPALGRMSSPFGPRDGRLHEGIDIAVNYGAPVYAAADGYVLYAGPAIGFGNEIVLQHSSGVITVYGHMERILVRYGQVRAGTAIALAGSEGDSTGPHLHFEVHVNDRPIDPYIWLRDHGVVFQR